MTPRPGHLAPALVLLAVTCAALPVAEAAPRKFSFGPVAGYSMQSSGPYKYSGGPKHHQEITLGPTFLLGATAELRLARHDQIAMELVVGPYRGDFETSCVYAGRLECYRDSTRVKVGGHLEGRYLRTFGDSQWRPLVGAGIGLKAYAYRDDDFLGRSSATSSLAIGVERSGRGTLRAEIRGVLVWRNALFYFFAPDIAPAPPRTYELQARISLLFPK